MLIRPRPDLIFMMIFLIPYSIPHYLIKFVSDLRHVVSFFPDTPVSSTNKTDRHDITDIVFKVALGPLVLLLPKL